MTKTWTPIKTKFKKTVIQESKSKSKSKPWKPLKFKVVSTKTIKPAKVKKYK